MLPTGDLNEFVLNYVAYSEAVQITSWEHNMAHKNNKVRKKCNIKNIEKNENLENYTRAFQIVILF